MNDMSLRLNYSPVKKVEPFYTGGSIEILQDGQRVISICESTIKILDLSSQCPLQTFEEDEDTPLSLVVSPDESLLVVSWRSRLIKQYNWKEGFCQRQWKGHEGPVVAMAIDPSSTLLATGSGDSSIKVWDMIKQYCTHHFRPAVGVVSLVKFHPEAMMLFSSSSDNSIRVWDLENSKCCHVLKSHVSTVTCIGFSKDGNNLISGGRDQVINYWDFMKGQLLKTLPIYEVVEGLIVLPMEMCVAKDHVTIATAGDKGIINIWDLTSGRCLDSLEQCDQGYVDLQYCPSINTLVGVASDQTLILYSLDNRDDIKFYPGYLDEILDIKCVGGNHPLVAVATNSENLKVYNPSNWSCDILRGHNDIILCLDIVDNILVTGSKDNTIRIWQLDPSNQQFNCYGIGRGHTLSVCAVACSKINAKFIVSGGQDRTLKSWNIKDLDFDDKSEIPVIYTQLAHEKDINSLDVSPNDKLIVSGSHDKTAKIWRASNGSLVGTLRGHRRGIWSVKFSPVDQCVLTSSSDCTIKLWSVYDSNCLKTFEGHTSSVLKAIFITKGLQIISIDNIGIIKLWNIKNNECKVTLDGHSDKIWAVTTPDDGHTLFTGGSDALFCQWEDITDKVLAEEKNKKEQNTLKEQYLTNLLQQQDYARAVGVAISLDQPSRVLTILTELLNDGGIEGDFEVTITSLKEDEQRALLNYASKWNTNSRYCLIAQNIWHVILRTTPPTTLLKIEGINDLLQGLIPYTERHFQRVSKLLQLTSFMDYTWQCMTLSGDKEGVATDMESEVMVPSPVIKAIPDSTTLQDDGGMFVVDKCPDVDLLHEEPTSTVESIAPQNSKKMKLKAKLIKKKRNVFM